MNKSVVKLRFPARGFTEHASYSDVPEGFTVRALNVVPFDVLEDRLRGGKRPGTARAIANPVDTAGLAVQRMGQVTLTAGSFIAPDAFFVDTDWDLGSGPNGGGEGGGWGFPRPVFIGIDPEEEHDELAAGTVTSPSQTQDTINLSYSGFVGGIAPYTHDFQQLIDGVWTTLDTFQTDEGVTQPLAVIDLDTDTEYRFRVVTTDNASPIATTMSSEIAVWTATEPLFYATVDVWNDVGDYFGTGDDYLDLNYWGASGGRPPYSIQVQVKDGDNWQTIVTATQAEDSGDPDPMLFRHEGLTPGTEYIYRTVVTDALEQVVTTDEEWYAHLSTYNSDITLDLDPFPYADGVLNDVSGGDWVDPTGKMAVSSGRLTVPAIQVAFATGPQQNPDELNYLLRGKQKTVYIQGVMDFSDMSGITVSPSGGDQACSAHCDCYIGACTGSTWAGSDAGLRVRFIQNFSYTIQGGDATTATYSSIAVSAPASGQMFSDPEGLTPVTPIETIHGVTLGGTKTVTIAIEPRNEHGLYPVTVSATGHTDLVFYSTAGVLRFPFVQLSNNSLDNHGIITSPQPVPYLDSYIFTTNPDEIA